MEHDEGGSSARPRRFIARCAAVLSLAGVLAGAPRILGAVGPANPLKPPAVGAAGAAEYPGLHNVFRVSEKLYSGAAPEGEEGFASLRALGIGTVITVDGARPDVVTARRFALRYVHLPFGYEGCPTPRALEITRAVRDLPGAVYLHCHHGKHRSPAAAALVHIALDGASNEQAVAFMKRAGTSAGYLGLYQDAASFRRPTTAQINSAPDQFPEVAVVPSSRRRWSGSMRGLRRCVSPNARAGAPRASTPTSCRRTRRCSFGSCSTSCSARTTTRGARLTTRAGCAAWRREPRR
jgi:hypothetical protein